MKLETNHTIDQLTTLNYPALLRQVRQRVALAQQRAIYAANEDNQNTQPAVAQLPEYNFSLPIRHIHWTHNVILMQRVKDIRARYWYMVQRMTSHWSKDYLAEAIKLDYYGKHGALAHNFDATLPVPEAKGVKSMLNDQDRIEIVRYRIDNAHRTLEEVKSHMENRFYNTAVNRMYYACYYAASELLGANHIITKSHDGVKQMFSLHFVKTGKVSADLGKTYSRLFDKRTKGDYNDLFDNDETTCKELYPEAKAFVALVSQLAEDWYRKHTTHE